MLPPVAPAALQRSVLQQEILLLKVTPRISRVSGYLSGQVGEQNLFINGGLEDSVRHQRVTSQGMQEQLSTPKSGALDTRSGWPSLASKAH